MDGERESKEVTKSIEGQFENAVERRGGLGFSADGIGLSPPYGSSTLASSNKVARAAAGEPNLQLRGSSLSDGDRDSKNRRSTKSHQSNAPMMDEFGREIRHELQHGSEGRSTRMSSQRYNSHGSVSKSRTSSEKRHQTSGRDSRSPHKTSLTSRVVLLKVNEAEATINVAGINPAYLLFVMVEYGGTRRGGRGVARRGQG